MSHADDTGGRVAWKARSRSEAGRTGPERPEDVARDTDGVRGPRESLSRPGVHDLGGAGQAGSESGGAAGRRLPGRVLPLREGTLGAGPGHRARCVRQPGGRVTARDPARRARVTAVLRAVVLGVRQPRSRPGAVRAPRGRGTRLPGRRHRRGLRAVHEAAAGEVAELPQTDPGQGAQAGPAGRRGAVRVRRPGSGRSAGADGLEVGAVPADRPARPVRPGVDHPAGGAARGERGTGVPWRAVRALRRGPACGRALRSALAHGAVLVVPGVRPRLRQVLPRSRAAAEDAGGRGGRRCRDGRPGERPRPLQGVAQDP